MVKITAVEKGSCADKAGLRAGDKLLSIGGHTISDVLDYRFYLMEKKLTVVVERDGAPLSFLLRKKDEYDDIGLEFETYLMDKKQRCRNKCIFCFIDQNPAGMRESVYFKDDDDRLSFFFGNYVTLTNLTDEEVARLIKMRISPVNISVHTTNPALRCAMMKNPRSGEVLKYLEDFRRGEILMNCQIVLCKGYNDGAELERTLSDLSALSPWVESIAVVPAGLTAHREGLCPLSPFTKADAEAVVATIDRFGKENLKTCGKRLVYASDEWYLRAGLPLPDEEYYEEYPQIENGVGMIRSMQDEVEDELLLRREDGYAMPRPRTVSLVTGEAAFDFIRQAVARVTKNYPQLDCRVYCAKNRFFGGSVTVAGLLTGSDMLGALEGKELGEELFIPACTLRHEQDLFLDDMSLADFSARLGVPVTPSANDGHAFVAMLLGE